MFRVKKSMGNSTSSIVDSRCGFHYFPDTLHYRDADLNIWLPELQALGAAWLILRSDLDRAIPESFIRGIKQAGIQPIIQLSLPLNDASILQETGTLLEVYARWGVRYVILFDRPNARSAWPAAGWAQQDLVERFLDRYLPAANLAYANGIVPVFPPLDPGGSYWDTAFLRSALNVIQRRKQEQLLQSLVLSAYGWTNGRSLNWGAGGPEAWPQARPYKASQTGQDQRGFRIFDWYQSIAREVLHQNVPVILLQAGLPGDMREQPQTVFQSSQYVENYKSILRLCAGEAAADPMFPENMLAPLPSQVIACNFWLPSLGGDGEQITAEEAESRGKPELLKWIQVWRREREAQAKNLSIVEGENNHSIRHYLLLPGTEWGVSDWYLEIIRPFVKKHLPTVGFSLVEAEKASQVTVVGNLQNYPEDLLSRLKKSGCEIDLINGDGTKIASELAER